MSKGAAAEAFSPSRGTKGWFASEQLADCHLVKPFYQMERYLTKGSRGLTCLND
ncbi:MAG TPA: hypothetical protein GXZ24_06825 [Firmicutes bacterium]|nr:hypothetical protein [Bacillota bacterium]